MQINFRICILSLFFFSGASSADSAKEDLEYNQSNIPALIKQTNKVGVASNKSVQRTLDSKGVAIPANWRLVNVIHKSIGNYVLFFQDKAGEVFSFGITDAGALTGSDVIHIPIQR